MTHVAPELVPPVRTLMGPGPSDIHPRVLQALAKGTVGHLDPYYLQLMDELQRMLRGLFRTENRMTIAVSATGSAGMEATVVNLIEPGDPMIVCVNGVFGGRMADVAARAGAQVTKVERPWGQVSEAIYCLKPFAGRGGGETRRLAMEQLSGHGGHRETASLFKQGMGTVTIQRRQTEGSERECHGQESPSPKRTALISNPTSQTASR